MKPTILLLAVIPPLIFLAACSDPQTAPTSPQAQVSVHPEGWAKDTASPNFHGAYLAPKQYNASECQPCHGSQYDGGISGVSCKQCHASYPHSEGWVGAHSNFIKSIHYDVNSCKPCHGQDYSTIKTNNSCLTCHTKPGGPEACNTCHGNFSGDPTDLTQDAPPRGLNGETSPTTPAVGAHQAHLAYFPAAAVASTCQECHTLPLNFSAPSHIDPDSKAEVLLNGALTRLITEGGARVPNPTYNSTGNTCAGTYCHGNWGLLQSRSSNAFIYSADKMEGGNASPKWTDAATAACGTCHGLPPTGHSPYNRTTCYICHPDVIDFNGNIIDKTKHVNGKMNVYGMEYPMF